MSETLTHDSFIIQVKYETGSCDIDTKGILLSALQKVNSGWSNNAILDSWTFGYTLKNSYVDLVLIDNTYDNETYKVIFNQFKALDSNFELDKEDDIFGYVEKKIREITYYSYRSIYSMDNIQKTDIKIISVCKK